MGQCPFDYNKYITKSNKLRNSKTIFLNQRTSESKIEIRKYM